MVIVISGHVATTIVIVVKSLSLWAWSYSPHLHWFYCDKRKGGGVVDTIDILYFIVFSCSLKIGTTTTIQPKKGKRRKGG